MYKRQIDNYILVASKAYKETIVSEMTKIC